MGIERLEINVRSEENKPTILLSGVPIRLELGPKDRANSQLTLVLRHTGKRSTIPLANSEAKIKEILEEIHNDLYAK